MCAYFLFQKPMVSPQTCQHLATLVYFILTEFNLKVIPTLPRWNCFLKRIKECLKIVKTIENGAGSLFNNFERLSENAWLSERDERWFELSAEKTVKPCWGRRQTAAWRQAYMQRSSAGSKQGHAEQLRGSQAWHREATEKGFFPRVAASALLSLGAVA